MEYFIGQVVNFKMTKEDSSVYPEWYKVVCTEHMYGAIVSRNYVYPREVQYGIKLCKPLDRKDMYCVETFSVLEYDIMNTSMYREV